MVNNKKSVGCKRINTEKPEGCFLCCSIDTKQKIESFFVNNMKFDIDIFPIIINGIRPFSLYEFKKNSETIYMLIVTKSGVNLINKICKDLKYDNEMAAAVFGYLSKHLKNEPRKVDIFKRIIPVLMHKYHAYRDKSNPYSMDGVNGRYICLIYPLIEEYYKGLYSLLHHISMMKEDDILRDRICIY